jgi:hypothetical protein
VVLCSNKHIELNHLMFDDASEMLVSEDSSTLEPSEGFQAARALSSMAAEVSAALPGALSSSLPSAAKWWLTAGFSI